MAAALGPLAARIEEPPKYHVVGDVEDDIINRALAIMERRIHFGDLMADPGKVKAYLALRCADLEHEEFMVLFLNTQNRLIECETMFTGTLNQTSVYPREIVKAALACNAAAVILAHNHPSGDPEPSRADQMLTQTIKAALALVDVRVLDHVIVGGAASVSLAERGLC